MTYEEIAQGYDGLAATAEAKAIAATQDGKGDEFYGSSHHTEKALAWRLEAQRCRRLALSAVAEDKERADRVEWMDTNRSITQANHHVISHRDEFVAVARELVAALREKP